MCTNYNRQITKSCQQNFGMRTSSQNITSLSKTMGYCVAWIVPKVLTLVIHVNDKYCAKFVDSIASVILDSVVSNIKASLFFSITCDSSADFTGDDYETLYVRTCHEGKLNDQFYFIGIPESGSVLSIHDFIVESFFSSGLDMEFETKLVSGNSFREFNN